MSPKPQRANSAPSTNSASSANSVKSEEPTVPKRLVRRLYKLEDEMRAYLPNLKRVPEIQTENQVKYFIKLFETFLSANSGTLRDEAIRQLVLQKLWLEYYLW